MRTEAKTKVVGLTGSIGSGKSEAARIFEELGAALIDSDVLARLAVEKGGTGLKEIRLKFGKSIVEPDGSLNRKALGQIVFADPEKRKQLEQILHPRIRELHDQEMTRLTSNPDSMPPLIVSVIPLLFESGYKFPELEKIIVVYAPRETCITRIASRDASSRELAETKFDSQISMEEKRDRGDIVINNTGSREELRVRVKEVYRELTG